MSASLAWALVFGCTLGLGLWSLAATVPRLSRPRLADRIAPYLTDISEEARQRMARRAVDPLPVLGSLAAPVLSALRGLMGKVFGGPIETQTRLRQAGSALTVERLRAEQLAWALAGCGAGVFAVMLAAGSVALTPGAIVVVPVVAAFLGASLREWLVRRAARARQARIAEELPTVLEFLTLSLSAGEGILDALRRVATTSSGELAAEFSGVIRRVSSGVSLPAALDELAAELQVRPLTRAIGQLTSALDRGTPLAGVLRAQASDARIEERNRLLEVAGRKEVAMLFPLVFLLLPLTVIIAVLPGLAVLQTGF